MKTNIKICGITNLEDAECVVDSGADMMGFIFYKHSPRYITPEKVGEITRQLPPEFATVGVFVNESNDIMRETAKISGIKILQLHGNESMDQLKQIKNFEIIKAVSLKTEADLQSVSSFNRYAVLIDAPTSDYGGSGKEIDKNLACQAVPLAPRVILAGGLTPENVSGAVNLIQPFGVDVSSGVERSKGLKDHAKVTDFVANVRRADSA